MDETRILHLKAQEAPIDIWGVGTKLVTCDDQPSMDIVYKMGAIIDDSGNWRSTLKRSDQSGKTTTPGIQQVRRFMSGDVIVEDILYDELLQIGEAHPPKGDSFRDLLVPVFRQGKNVYDAPSLDQSREKARTLLSSFNQPKQHAIRCVLEARLQAKKNQLLTTGDTYDSA